MNKPAFFCFLLEASLEVYRILPYVEGYITQFIAYEIDKTFEHITDSREIYAVLAQFFGLTFF